MSSKTLGKTLIEKSMSKIIQHQDMRLCTIKINFTTFGISRGKKKLLILTLFVINAVPFEQVFDD